MCGGVEVTGRYTQTGQQLRIYFPNPRAALPVRQADGAVAWVAWGRRKEQPGHLPATAIPSTLLVDPRGRIAARIIGETTEATVVGLIDDLAAGK